MLGIKDLETRAGKVEFEEYRVSVGRFIKSKVFSPDDAEEMTQETSMRVLKKLAADETFTVNGGYFINTAKFVLKEHYHRTTLNQERFETPSEDDSQQTAQPPDAQLQIENYKDRERRDLINDCLLECLSECSVEDQKLLWSYSFDNKIELEEDHEDSNGDGLLDIRLTSLRDIRSKFSSIKNGPLAMKEKSRLKVFRLREGLKACRNNCIDRKKGYA